MEIIYEFFIFVNLRCWGLIFEGVFERGFGVRAVLIVWIGGFCFVGAAWRFSLLGLAANFVIFILFLLIICSFHFFNSEVFITL